MAWYLLACACQTVTKDLYQVYETFKNLCEFSSVWAENFWRFANANFEGLFYVFMGKKSTKWEFLHNCTKTLINIKVTKRWILVSKYSFSNLSCIFLSLMLLNLNIFFQFETNLQEQLKKTFCYQNWFWPFNVWKNYSSDLKHFSRSSRTIFSHSSSEQFC